MCALVRKKEKQCRRVRYKRMGGRDGGDGGRCASGVRRCGGLLSAYTIPYHTSKGQGGGETGVHGALRSRAHCHLHHIHLPCLICL